SSRGYQEVQEINVGATATETFTWTAQAGSHTFKAVADSKDAFAESDETNNEKTVTLSVSLALVPALSPTLVPAPSTKPQKVPAGKPAPTRPPEKGTPLFLWVIVALMVLGGILIIANISTG
ncbi:CARDB domain-containing protein, partial [Chloroflexota bacterium]